MLPLTPSVSVILPVFNVKKVKTGLSFLYASGREIEKKWRDFVNKVEKTVDFVRLKNHQKQCFFTYSEVLKDIFAV